jgi:hypothetical protein
MQVHLDCGMEIVRIALRLTVGVEHMHLGAAFHPDSNANRDYWSFPSVNSAETEVK